jgi:hypothetical protein
MQGDWVLVREMDPNRPDIAQQVSDQALDSGFGSHSDSKGDTMPGLLGTAAAPSTSKGAQKAPSNVQSPHIENNTSKRSTQTTSVVGSNLQQSGGYPFDPVLIQNTMDRQVQFEDDHGRRRYRAAKSSTEKARDELVEDGRRFDAPLELPFEPRVDFGPSAAPPMDSMLDLQDGVNVDLHDNPENFETAPVQIDPGMECVYFYMSQTFLRC